MNKVVVAQSDSNYDFSLWPYFRKSGLAIFLVTILSIVLGFATTALGLAMGPVFELLFGSEDLIKLEDVLGSIWSQYLLDYGVPSVFERQTVVLYLPFFLVGLSFFKFAANFIIFYYWEYFSENISYDFRQRMAHLFLRSAPAYLFQEDKRSLADRLPSTVSHEIRQMRQYVVRFFGSMPREILQVIFLVIAMILLSPKLFFIFLFVVAPFGIVVQKLSKKIKRRSGKALDHFSELSDWILKRLLGFETIKQMETERLEVQNMEWRSDELERKFYAIVRPRAITSPLVETVSIIAIGVVLFLSSLLILDNLASASVQISFFSCLALLSQASSKLGRYVTIQAEGKAVLERLQNFTSEVQHIQAFDLGHISDAVTGRVALRVQNLTVQRSEDFTLHVDNMEVKFGEIVGLCGGSGSGKSSLIYAILDLTPIASGDIYCAVEKNTEHKISRAYLTQDYLPFYGSIAENIVYPLPLEGIAPERIQEALQEAAWLDVSPEVLERRIGLGLPSLSGGQLQRLALARVFFHRPQFIVLDECTSALDPQAEAKVLENLARLAESGAAVLMSAHKKNAIAHCHRVLYFSAGRVGDKPS